MSSSAGSGKNGGILRSSSSSGTKKRPAQKNAMEVTFGGPTSEQTISRPTRPSPSDQEYTEYGSGGRVGRSSGNGNVESSGGGYDSDDLYDASMAAGGVLPSTLSAGGNTKEGGTNDDDDDGLPHDQAEIDAAKRQRRKLADAGLADRADEIDRLEEEDDHAGNGGGRGGSKMGSLAGGDNNHQGSQKGEFRGEEDLNAGLSLISSTAAASAANPADPHAISGAYDAGSNAACPVEPFNLRAEREGGEGYFDGDTYVFRRLEEGGRAMDEEPDAWLDELGGSPPLPSRPRQERRSGVGPSTRLCCAHRTTTPTPKRLVSSSRLARRAAISTIPM